MSPRRCIILNPRSGRGRADKLRPQLERELHAAGIACNIVPTAAPGDAVRLARLLCQQGYEQLYVMGGDGTINEVLTGIFSVAGDLDHSPLPEPPAALGFIPIGTGNDFVRSLPDIRANHIASAVQRMHTAAIRRIDVGCVRVTSHTAAGPTTQPYLFLNNLALGIDAIVADKVGTLHLLDGLPAYLAASLLALLDFTPHTLRLHADAVQLERPLLLASVTNGQYQGGGFRLTPAAVLDDGLLDLCLVEPMRTDQALRALPHAVRGTHARLPQVQLLQAQQIHVSFSVPHTVVTDGEVVSRTAVQVHAENMARALRIIG